MFFGGRNTHEDIFGLSLELHEKLMILVEPR